MGYKKQTILTVPVSEEWGDGLWIKIKNPAMLSWSEQKALARVKFDDGDGLDAVDALYTFYIVDWNLPYLDGRGGVVPIPGQDASALEQVPSELLKSTLEAILTQPVEHDDPNS